MFQDLKIVNGMEKPEEKAIYTTCASHCGGTCLLKVHVKDDIITRIETDDGEEPQLRACLKGRAYRQRIYDPHRLLYPLKRTGHRGEGKFERITWEEALNIISKELIRIRDAYGPSSILYLSSAGDINQIHNLQHIHRLLCHAGGYTRLWGTRSFQGGISASLATYGTARTDNARDDLINSRLIILWGWNPAVTVGGTNTCWYLAQARESGAKVIVIDPRYTDTAAAFADRWIPIRPGTDSAVLIAMAYTIINERLYDEKFVEKYTFGFERFKDYVLGIEDGAPKTPAWAEKISSVPAREIEYLAREYANIKPAALMAGIAPGRTAYGEQYHRAAMTLSAITANVGKHGGHAAGRVWESALSFPYKMQYGLSFKPVKGYEKETQKVELKKGTSIHTASLVHRIYASDFILKGIDGGYPADLRAAIFLNINYVNQDPDINKTVEALRKLEFILVFEQVMTATAKFADVVLPTAMFLERNDIDMGVGTPFYGFVNKVIEPLGECRSHYEIARDLSKYMGISDFGEEDEEGLIKKELIGTEIENYEKFKEKVIYRIHQEEPYVAFKKQIQDPSNNPFPTPSGKIEIYSQVWASPNNEELPPIPKYIDSWEGINDPLIRKYPLQLITTHFRRRTHSQFEFVPWLRELEEHAVLINTVDAEKRGIENGNKVRVFNDRGELIIMAKVTERIMPGVVNIPQGAWYAPNGKGIDQGGNPNILTKCKPSPGGAFPYNTSLVEVKRL